MKKIIIIILAISLFWSCKENSNRYEIIDCKYNSKNNVAAYSVYTPDTNWVEMEKFAKDLLKDKDKHSAVHFFNPREKALKYKDNWAFQEGTVEYVVAAYYFSQEKDKLIFQKTSNRFRPEMHFEE